VIIAAILNNFFKHPGKIKRRKQNPNRKKKEKKTGKNYYLKL